MSGTGEERVVNTTTGGEKGSKSEDYSLLPWEQLGEVARLYSFGSKKYSRGNWQKGYAWHLSFASLMRHAAAWWNGEFVDEESGCDHMTSVVFHALALMYFRQHHPDLDDRPCTEIVARQAATTPDDPSEAPSEPQGGAVAVFRHVGPGPMTQGGPLYYVRTGMEAPAGYRFSHIVDSVPTVEVSFGQQIVPNPTVSRRIDRMADGTPVPQALNDAPLEDSCGCLHGAGCDGSCGASRP